MTASRHDSKVANLKGKYRELNEKIKIRDHFEHVIDMGSFPEITPRIKLVTSVVINKSSAYIISGKNTWDLVSDHERFKGLVREFVGLFPYTKADGTKKDIKLRLG